MKKSMVYNKAFALAVKIVQYCRWLKQQHEYELAKQLLRCGTSVGANLAEANGAVSDSDFSSKISIAYKETLETKFWMDLLREVELLDKAQYQLLHADADEIAKMLFSILKTTRISKQ